MAIINAFLLFSCRFCIDFNSRVLGVGNLDNLSNGFLDQVLLVMPLSISFATSKTNFHLELVFSTNAGLC
jgi:hypothetical protein